MANYFPDLVISEVNYDFSHLDPFIMMVKSDMAKKELKVHVRFTNHCFTRGYEAFSHPEGEPVIPDHSGNERTFCPIRYRLSLSLPSIINGLVNPQEKVFQTAARRNWAYSITIDDPAGPYHLFFEIRRASRDERHLQDLNVVVESAYHEEKGYGPPDLLGRIGFVALCGRVYCRKPLATKR
ncbi:hypothetical protein [Staphylococcus pseudintermedius]|uniref:hypothetical protein n=1 Tax=Staphylococcus pseudintermedius TaxID=283734 RepID=UPI0016555DEB|nr:hypothetical protein [Staphylococcus pseudintermedius]MBC8679354.1 hypothetical protein [Staphylococcus pseudintermedius]MBC8705363.1 hypothetical protein [Staphylococcus pseudintermedius]MDU2152688.1 hypothetical protein [Weissella confusa]